MNFGIFYLQGSSIFNAFLFLRFLFFVGSVFLPLSWGLFLSVAAYNVRQSFAVGRPVQTCPFLSTSELSCHQFLLTTNEEYKHFSFAFIIQ